MGSGKGGLRRRRGLSRLFIELVRAVGLGLAGLWLADRFFSGGWRLEVKKKVAFGRPPVAESRHGVLLHENVRLFAKPMKAKILENLNVALDTLEEYPYQNMHLFLTFNQPKILLQSPTRSEPAHPSRPPHITQSKKHE